MNKKAMSIALILVIIGSQITIINSSAQDNTLTLRLQNEITQSPVPNATYQYGSKNGITDQDGYFKIEPIPENKLHISHITFGTFTFSNDEIKAFSDGIISIPESSIAIQPLTIMAVHGSIDQAQKVNIESPDRLAHDAGDVLNSLPEIAGIKKSGSYGIDPVLRGFKYDQLNIVIDGAQHASAACPNRMDPPTSQVAPNMIENIEILKGPHSLRFGNAFGGTINFKSTNISFSDKTLPFGRISGHYSSNGNVLRSEAMLGIKGKKYHVGMFGSWSQGDDYTDGENNNVSSDFSRGSLGVQTGIKISAKQKINFSIIRNDAKDTDFPALPMDLRSDETWLSNLSHKVFFVNRSIQSLHTSIYYTKVNHYMDNLLKIIDPRMVDATTDALTINYGGRSEAKWSKRNWLVYTGVDVRIQYAEGERSRTFLMGPLKGNVINDNAWQETKVNNYGLFGELNYIQNKSVITFSARTDINHAKANDPESNFLSVNPTEAVQQTNLSVSLGAKTSINQHIKTSVWFGRAQRSGSITERYINSFPVGIDPYEMLGNPDLKKETNHQADLEFQFSNKNLNISTALFSSLITNYISSNIDTNLTPVIPSSPGVRQYKNLDKAFLTGLELSAVHQLTQHIQHELKYVYLYGQSLDVKEPLPEIAPYEINYSVRWSLLNGKLIPEGFIRYVAKQNRVSDSFGEHETPSFTLVNMEIKYQPYDDLHFHLGINNVFNQLFYEHLSRSVRSTTTPIYEPGRNIYLTFVYNFMKN